MRRENTAIQFTQMDLGLENNTLTRKKVFAVVEKICRFAVIAVLLVAAFPKLLNIADFAQVINAYGMLPAWAVQPMAVFLPIFEIVLAVGLLLNLRVSKYLTVVLLVFFIIILSIAISQGLDIDCGCFGPEDPEHTAFQGLRVAVVRDVVMIVLLAYSIWYHKCR
jgi:hypothetical protein